jgi:hypothetical protein
MMMMKIVEQWRSDGEDGKVDGGGRKKKPRFGFLEREGEEIW